MPASPGRKKKKHPKSEQDSDDEEEVIDPEEEKRLQDAWAIKTARDRDEALSF
jgi:hypothetical protein